MRISRLLTLAAATSLLAVAACDMPHDAPKTGSLTQNLTMVDSTGRIFGSVQLDPINGGKMFDADGRLIGRIVTPAPTTLAPLAQ